MEQALWLLDLKRVSGLFDFLSLQFLFLVVEISMVLLFACDLAEICYFPV